jgi:O-antigen/teichoic acid export membrane protein
MRKSILANYLALLAAGVVSNVMLLVAFAVLARHLSREAFGAFNFNLAFISFALLPNLGLQFYATREVAAGRDDARFDGSLLTFRLALSLVVYGAAVPFVRLAVPSVLTRHALLVMAGMIFWQSLYLEWFFNGRERMTVTALCNLVQPALLMALALVAVRSDRDWPCLALGYALSYLPPSLLALAVYGAGGRRLRLVPDLRLWKETLRRGFPISVSFVVAQIYVAMAAIFLQYLKGEAAVASYSAAYRVILSLNAGGVLFINVVFPVAAKLLALSDHDGLRRLLPEVEKWIVLAVLPLACGLILRAREILLFLYPAPYADAAMAFRIQAGTLVVIWMCALYARLLLAAGRVRPLLLTVSAAAGVNLVCNAVLIPRFGITGAAAASLLAEVSSFAIAYRFAARVFPNPFARFLIRPGLACAAMAAALVVLPASLWISIPAAALTYGVVLVAVRGLTREDLAAMAALLRR